MDKHDDVIVIERPLLGIISYGRTIGEALKSYYEDLLMVWEEYALAPDHELSEDARELKSIALQILSSEGDTQ